MVRAGHAAVHEPHPMHLAAWISALLSWFSMGAPYGQTLTQVAQATQFFGSTWAICPAISRCERDRIVAARPAAALAWAIVSSMNRGEWASPHRYSPSLAKSTGLSLGWASRKKPSAVRAVRK